MKAMLTMQESFYVPEFCMSELITFEIITSVSTNRQLLAAGLHPLVEKHSSTAQTLVEICRLRGSASVVNAANIPYLQPFMFPLIYVMYFGVQQQNAI
jgi:hypothetical protein